MILCTSTFIAYNFNKLSNTSYFITENSTVLTDFLNYKVEFFN